MFLIQRAVDVVPHRQAGGAKAYRCNDAGELVRRNDAVALVAEWVTQQWPVQLGWGYAACAQLYEDVADGRHRLRCVLVFQSTDASALMRADSFSSLLCSFAGMRP